MKVARIFLKFIFSIIISLGIFIFVVQEDPWAKKMLSQKIIKGYSSSFDCSMQCEISSFNIFDLSICLENVKVTPRDKNDQSWWWGVKAGVIRGSWWQVLKMRMLDLTCFADNLSIHSDFVDNQFIGAKHIQALLASPLKLPIAIKNFSVSHGNFSVHDKNRNMQVSVGYNSRSILLGQKSKTAVSVTHTDLRGAQAIEYISDLTGQLECDIITRPSGIDVQASGHLNFTANLLPEDQNQFILSGSWRDGSGFFDIHNDEYTIGGSVATVGNSLIAQTTATIPVSYIEKIMRPGQEHYLDGFLSVNGRADIYDFNNFFELKLCCENFGFQQWHSQALNVEVKKSEGIYVGVAGIDIDPLNSLELNFSLNDVLTSGSLLCSGKMPLLPLYDKSLTVEADFLMEDKKLSGLCSIDALLDEDESNVQLKAEVSGDLENTLLVGKLNNNPFSLKGCVLPLPFIFNIESSNVFGDELLYVAATQQDIDARIAISLVKSMLHHLLDEKINGEGFLSFKGKKIDNGLQGMVHFSDGAIRIPMIYNGITGLDFDYYVLLDQKQLFLKNIKIDFHKGAFDSNELSASWQDDGTITRFCAPIKMKDCFISHHKDFFAIISGDVRLEKNQKHTNISGAISIDRAHLKGNVLEEKVQGDVLMPSFLIPYLGFDDELVTLDLSLATKEPMRVKTPFLQTSASIQASVRGDIHNLEGSGAIELHGGSLSFPYKPLYISTGKIMLMPEQLDDPVIELRAKNTLKKYGVSVLASGTVKNPKISFTSTPALSEEQIITLLCTGSEDAGLISAVPSVIMHNIQELIFGPADEATSFSKYFQKIFRPFGNIRVVPTIGDSKEHPGLHASVEVDVNERIHGSVHKNLSAPEDTKIELEYALSDEMSIRGTRDERGDLSAEVEFRFSL